MKWLQKTSAGLSKRLNQGAQPVFSCFLPKGPLQKTSIDCNTSLVPNLWDVPRVTLLHNI